MKNLIFFLAMSLVMPIAQAAAPVAKISVFASGKLLLNGAPTDLAAIEQEFKKLQAEHGDVWYYRENAQAEPPQVAMSVIQLVVKYKLPISMSSKPDFSDYIDGDGNSHPRQH